MNGNDSFGNWLKARRKALDLTQAELADRVGCAAITIRKIESDGYRPSKQISERLADILAISPQQRTEFVAFARGTGGSIVFAAPMSAPRPHNLPIQQTSLIGRADELAQIAERLADPACRLLTLVGVGGIGKTRLALQAAAEQFANFADGIYFVSLTGVSAPNLVASAIAGGLGISFYGPEDPHVQLVNYLRGKKLLLVLDNFEHLLGATGLLTDTLAAAPAVKLLVTSRERLNLQEEWVIAVEGLAFPLSPSPSPLGREMGTGRTSPPSPHEMGERVGDRGTEGYPAVQLFVQRARQVQADFSLEQDATPVVAICRYVEGMPLGLELAANWLRVMTRSQIAAQLAHSLDLPAMSPRNAPERHRSIRAIFDHSWALFTADEQAVFRKLAVFRGGFEREAAGQVANASFHSLAALIDKSMLRMNADGRYDLHELVRQYAEQQLEASGETISAQADHSAYYMGFRARLDADVKGRRQMAALREIRTDFDNIRAAWQWASEHRQHEAIRRAANCLINVGEMNSVLPDVHAILQQTAATLAPAQGEPPHPVWEQVIVRREWANSHLQHKVDQESVETILEHARERSDQEEIAWCLWVLTDCAAFGDDRGHAVAIAEASLAQRRALADEFYIAHALIGVCEFYWSFQLKRVLECTQESAIIRRRLGDVQGLCFSLIFLGESQLLDGHLREADLYFDEGVRHEVALISE